MQTILYLSFGILIGMLFPVPASFSSHLSSYSKTPLTPSFIAFGVGTMLSLLLNLIINPASLLGGIDFSYPAYIYIGGALAGVGYNVANILLFSKIGASIAAIITITGQMAAGIIIDHFGLFGITEKVISAQRVIGILIMLYAVYLIQKEKGNFKRSSQIGWIVMGVFSGSLPPLQAAINAKLRYATGSILSATCISFFVGTLILIALILLSEKRLEFPIFDENKQRIPVYYYLSGIFGIIIVGGNIILIPILGSVLTSMVFILGQIAMSLIIDQVGLFHLQKRSVTKTKIAALALIVTGILFAKI